MTQISKGSEKFRTLPLWQNTWPKEKYYEEGESPTVFIKNKKQTNKKKKAAAAERAKLTLCDDVKWHQYAGFWQV